MQVFFTQGIYVSTSGTTNIEGCHGRDRTVVGFITTYAISAFNTDVVSLNYAPGEVYSIQHYVIKFVSDLWQVGSFHRLLPPIN